jgi:hypothetical protein
MNSRAKEDIMQIGNRVVVTAMNNSFYGKWGTLIEIDNDPRYIDIYLVALVLPPSMTVEINDNLIYFRQEEIKVVE